jgi:hypothetical protein
MDYCFETESLQVTKRLREILSELPFPVTAQRTSGKPETSIFLGFQEMFTCFEWNFVLKKNPDMAKKKLWEILSELPFPVTAPRTSGKPKTSKFGVLHEMLGCFE